MFTLAHLSDPHLAPLRRPRLFELVGKRAIGHANWRLRRHVDPHNHALEAVVEDMRAAAPDHIAVTGDLVNTAADGEFRPARAFLDRLGSGDTVSVVPGNHDAYVRSGLARAIHHWAPFMAGDASPDQVAASRTGGDHPFPFLRRRGPIALIGLSTAVPTGPFMAWGRLGTAQLDALGPLLSRLAGERLFRVVALHHPPLGSERDRFKRLVDRAGLVQVLRRHGAELVLHGHNHIGSVGWIDGPSTAIPVVGVPSASTIGHHGEAAGYNLYRVSADAAGWRCLCDMRRRDPSGSGIISIGQQMLHPRPG